MVEKVAVAPSVRRRGRKGAPCPSREILPLFPKQGEWTEAEYLALPETNHIVELSEGRVIVPDMPTDTHQATVGEVFATLRSFVRENGLGQVRVAPLRVRLWPGKFREPDVVFMHRDHADRITEDYWGVPDLVVEVISPRTERSSGTETLDRGDKFSEYARAGVREYWLIDPPAHTIEVYQLGAGVYHLACRAGQGESARSHVLSGLEIPVDEALP